MKIEPLILIVDDHASVRAGIKASLLTEGFSNIAEASSHAQAVSQVAALKPDALVVDIHLGDGDGISLVKWVRSISDKTAILVLSLADSDDYILAAMNSGASSFISKSAPLNEVTAALKHALETPEVFSSRILPASQLRRKQSALLTPRELAILIHLTDGLSNRELAEALFISESTLKTHLSSIFRKLQVKNRVQAVASAKKSGLLREDH